MATRLGPAGRYVDPVFQHSRRHHLGCVRELVRAGSVGFLKMLLNTLGSFSLPRRSGAQRFIFDARASNRHFFEASIWTVAHRRGLFAMSNFRERLRTLRIGLPVRPTSRKLSIRCASLDGCRRFLHCPLFQHPKLVTRENGRPETSCSRFFEKSCTYNTSQGVFLGRCFSVKISRATARSRDLLPFVLPFVMSTPLHTTGVWKQTWHGIRWSYADNFGVLARGADCTNVRLARLIAGVQKASLDVHDTSLANGSADVHGCEVSPASQWSGSSGNHVFTVARTVPSRRRMSGRAMELVNGHESFLALSNRGALSIFDAMQASGLRGRLIWFQ